VQLTLAFLALTGMFVAAFMATRRELSRSATLLIIAAPLAAAVVYVLVGTKALPDHAQTSSPAPTVADSGGNAGGGEATGSTTPADTAGGKVAALRSQADDARRAKNYAQAANLFREVTQVAPFDPDGWADLGDAQAAAGGGDLKAGEAAIDRALELDPRHAKALWLKASLELQMKRFASAADLWRRLLKELPADSSDAKIVQTNLEEAERLAGGAGTKR